MQPLSSSAVEWENTCFIPVAKLWQNFESLLGGICY